MKTRMMARCNLPYGVAAHAEPLGKAWSEMGHEPKILDPVECTARHASTLHTETGVNGGEQVASIYFVGPYKPIMCGIADYTSYVTRGTPAGRWGVLSFDLRKYGFPLLTSDREATGQVCYDIPSRHEFSASVILEGLKKLGAGKENSVVWFQHEFGIWPHRMQFVAMLKNLDIPKVVTFHTLHFQSSETPTGLRGEEYDLLRTLLPHVDAITVFSRGVYHAVTSAFPQYCEKVYVVKHGIHSYPEISRLSRKEAKEKLHDFLLYESGLDKATKEVLHRQRIFLDSETTVIGQTGFLSPSKGSELLYRVKDDLEKLIPRQRMAAVRIGSPREDSQKIYAQELRRKENGADKFLLETWLPQNVLPLAQRAFDINFYWPSDCTQSGVLAHALGTHALVAGRDLEGVGETLKESGGLTDVDLRHLVLKIRDLMLNPELEERLEETVKKYAAEFSWENQAERHYELAQHILPLVSIPLVRHSPLPLETMAVPAQ